ncbi:glycosyltransferase family 4 protein [Variovorax sp. YR216]|uniref:glycosyltransferase family 4 protein n=1 Tax=Variovorax sp. YR216 TaxID=1882828 RepID=UPI00089C69F2|nr:glycosyltransferase family 4 protein [Variovorax sp. YR216]SEA73791.1 Glycosyltransferase involved in cell wall bisynthesis [Variovorax sp. YR216]
MKIAYVHSICNRYDAISGAINNEIGWLQKRGHEVTFYAYSCEYDHLPHRQVEAERDVVFDLRFQESDLAIFHFGVYYPLFNTVIATPKSAKRLVIFHNITPKEFVSPAARETIDRSFKQISNMAFSQLVICDSETNRNVLSAAGVTVPTSVIPLSIQNIPKSVRSKPSFSDHVPRIVFVGRLVASKGVLDLLEAVRRILQASPNRRLQMDMIGNLSFSDPQVVEEAKCRIQTLESTYDGLSIELHGNATEVKKYQVLSEADLFVLPTLHEGFCIPILEALSNGCRVVTYENSNTPAISGGFADLVETGNLDALSATVSRVLEEVSSDSWRNQGGHALWAKSALQYTKQFSPDAVEAQFIRAVERFAGS